jgi:small subunit ribosomal protein S18
MVESERRSQFQRQIHRKWQAGDVYSPTDLSGAEQKKWKFGRKKPQSDAFDVLGINPVLEYKVRRPSRGPTGAG